MEKPTTALNLQIIDLVHQEPGVKELRGARDKHRRTFGVEINCRLNRRQRPNPTRSLYIVEFICYVENSPLEKTDDVSVTVEVREGTPPTFNILKVETF